ncbi:hypothetical protein CEE37_06025 [candidate division LCP-89 bacterium B3_LCP]|uniref:Peptidase M6-like domain-containing protein n=1 Tax=candidate division LCP-89 bacterium B3_LCP TaxID=2012998 RepID=A0A532V1W7_UNCL8|nr:MAG: hypothetical protein CEE37_06025 [candidate division LCP-89 bacterium B3_LCP]
MHRKNLPTTLAVLFSLLLIAAFAANIQANIQPAPGLYDPITLKSNTTGDPYPIFPDDANRIPPMNLDRTDEVDQALTILIRTPDIANQIQPESFDSLLYSTGIYPTGSMNDYFLESSYGAFGVDGEVVGWVMANNNYSYYTWNNYGFGSYPHNAQKLAEEAVLAADALGVDFSQYDNDGDGRVDALIIVHQGPGAENTGSVNDIWSHRWSFPEVYLDGVYVSDYSMDPELAGTGITGGIESIGVFAHEYTHLLGLPDLYDYDEKLNPNTFTVLGDDNDHPVMDWGIMGYGGYGISSYGRGSSPNHHASLFKSMLGWVDPVILGLSQTGIQVPDYEANPVVYKIPISGSETEYFLVANRNPDCLGALFDKWDSDFSAWFNWFTPGSNPLDAGLVIEHVDEEVDLNNGTPDEPHYGCIVVDAGYTSSQPWPGIEFTEWWYPYEFRVGAAFSAEDGQTELTPLTDPSSGGYYGPSGVYITNISNSGPLMTFDLEFIGGTADLIFSGSVVEDDGGDADGFLDAGETGDLYLRLKNLGSGEALQVSGTLHSTDPYITIIQNQAAFPDIGITLSGENITPFVISVDANCPAGYDAEATLLLTWLGGNSATSIPLELSWDVVLANDVESGMGGWTHDVAFGDYNDQWHISTMRNHTPDGFSSWKCGSEGSGGYGALLNAELVTPSLNFTSNARVSFWHRMNAEADWDGGIIEMEIGGTWVQITPMSGYPDQITHTSSGGPFAYGTQCYSSDFDWAYERAELPYSGDDTQVRFRFGSDQGVGEEGWYLDDFVFYQPEAAPPAMVVDVDYVSGSPVSAGGGNLYYTIWGENQGAVPLDYDIWIDKIYESTDTTTLILREITNYQPGWQINRPDAWYPVPAVWPGGNYDFRIYSGWHPEYEVWHTDAFSWVKDGPVDLGFDFESNLPLNAPNPFEDIMMTQIDNAVPAQFEVLGAYPNPFNPSTVLSYQLPVASLVNLSIYDISGRLVTELVNGWRDAGVHEVTFNGSALASGIYIYQLDIGSYSASGKMVLMK